MHHLSADPQDSKPPGKPSGSPRGMYTRAWKAPTNTPPLTLGQHPSRIITTRVTGSGRPPPCIAVVSAISTQLGYSVNGWSWGHIFRPFPKVARFLLQHGTSQVYSQKTDRRQYLTRGMQMLDDGKKSCCLHRRNMGILQ